MMDLHEGSTPITEIPTRLAAALADRYGVVREIGTGGMATVYLAEDVRHNRKVAVKVLRPELAASMGHARFLREISIAASLQHPHILPLFDSGDADGYLFYVMPYAEGLSARQKLVRETELPIIDAVRILRDVADAMAYAHDRGVVHRDIKPENVMLSGRHALVMDFGVAKAIGDAVEQHGMTTGGLAIGTPAYMAPEQAAGDPHIDHRADIYAFGILAYELLTGAPPFLADTPQGVIAKQITATPAPLAKRRESVPAALEALTLQCLAKKPADRVQSAELLLTHLESLMTPSGGMTPAATYFRRTRWGTSWRAAAALLVAVAGIAAAWAWTGSRRKAAVSELSLAPATQLTFDGNVEMAELSPDGNWLAWITLANNTGATWVQDLGSGSAPLRIGPAASWSAIRWSTEGTSLFYVGPDTTGARVSVLYPRTGGRPRWTNRYAYYAAFSSAAPGLVTWFGNANRPLQARDVHSGNVLDSIQPDDSVVFRKHGSWSPSGAYLVYTGVKTGPPERYDLFTLRWRDSTLRLLLEDSIEVMSPVWTASGDAVLYLRDGDLWRLPMRSNGTASGTPTRVRAGLGSNWLSASRDGKTIVYIADRGRSNLWLAPERSRDGSSMPVELTTGTGFSAGSPSPDGSRIGISWRVGASGHLRLIHLNELRVEELSGTEGAIGLPAWSRDGTRLAYVARANGTFVVRVIALASKAQRTYDKTAPSSTGSIAWAPGNRILYHQAGNRNFQLLDPDTGSETPLVSNDSVGWLFDAHYSPDGSHVVASWNRSRMGLGLWLISVADGSQRLLTRGEYVPLGWSSDQRSIVVKGPQSGHFIIATEGNRGIAPYTEIGDSRFADCVPFERAARLTHLCRVAERSQDAWIIRLR